MPPVDPNLVEVYTFRRLAAGVEFLLLRRRDDDFMGGTWHPVSGGIEPGESAYVAAQRELFEEASLTPQKLWNINSVHAFYTATYDRVFCTVAFVAEVDPEAEVKLSHEHTDLRWIKQEDLIDALMWPGQKVHARELLEHIVTPSHIEPYLRIALQGSD